MRGGGQGGRGPRLWFTSIFFLAAMSNSRSDDVTKSVSVCLHSFCLV